MNAQPPASAPQPVKLGSIAKVVIVLILIGLVIGLVPRWLAHRRLRTEIHDEGAPTVSVIQPAPSKASAGTPLPANVQAFVQASIHARASGYLKNWYVDLGDHVTNGQVLAEIDSPELDQQFVQAQAELGQTKAALDLAKTTSDRWTELLKTSSVSEQETAEKSADFTLKQANMAAAEANVHRLQDLRNFEKVVAPFTGTVIARNTDIGQLISADGGPELFRVAQTDPLRVFVRVPQQYVYTIKAGQKADLIFLEMGGKTYEARVTRTAGAIDPTSRTLEVELQVDNPNGELFSGSYAQVRFREAASANILTVSDNALIFRAQGTQLAMVRPDNTVELRSVKLGRDFGNTVEILSGIAADDRVINNPSDSIAEGMAVQIAKSTETNKPATTSIASK